MHIMQNRIVNEINKSIDRLDFKDKRVFIFGVNDFSNYIINYLEKLGIIVERILDNNIEKKETYVGGIEVVLPKEYLNPVIGNALILIASRHVKEMSKQLELYGYNKKNIVSILNLFGNRPYLYNHCMLDELYKILDSARNGECIISDVKKRYGEDACILYIPEGRLGDTYLICIYIKAYLRNKKIEKYVFLLCGNTAINMLKSIGYTEIYELNNQEENANVLSYLKLYDFKRDGVITLFYDISHTQIIAGLMQYQNISMLEGYRIWLDVNKNEEICFPQFEYKNEDIDSVVHRFNIEKNNTVIVAPYAKSLKLLNFKFWEKLCTRLLNKGFKVFTNVSNDMEKAILGTEAIKFDMKIAQVILEKAGYFIGLRSGFCDVVCNTECKKIILYPDYVYEMGDVYETCSFERMKIGKNFYELKCKYDDENNIELLNKVEALITDSSNK